MNEYLSYRFIKLHLAQIIPCSPNCEILDLTTTHICQSYSQTVGEFNQNVQKVKSGKKKTTNF